MAYTAHTLESQCSLLSFGAQIVKNPRQTSEKSFKFWLFFPYLLQSNPSTKFALARGSIHDSIARQKRPYCCTETAKSSQTVDHSLSFDLHKKARTSADRKHSGFQRVASIFEYNNRAPSDWLWNREVNLVSWKHH